MKNMEKDSNGRQRLTSSLVIHLLDRWKYVLVLVMIVSFSAGFFISGRAEKVYRASGKIYPLSKTFSSNVLKQFAGISGDAGSPSSYLKAIVHSDTFVRRIIKNVELEKVLGEDLVQGDAFYEEMLVINYRKRFQITEDPDGSLIISFKDNSPELAAEVVNTIIEELKVALKEEAETNVVYLESQVKNTEDKIIEAEHELEDFRLSHGIAAYEKGTEQFISMYSDILKQRYLNESELNAVATRFDFTGDLEQEELYEEELKAIQARLDSEGEIIDSLDSQLSTFPENEKKLLQIERKLYVYGELYKTLVTQYELEKLEARKNNLKFTVIDWAYVAPKPVSPRPLFNACLSMLLSFLAVFFLMLFFASAEPAGKTDQQ